MRNQNDKVVGKYITGYMWSQGRENLLQEDKKAKTTKKVDKVSYSKVKVFCMIQDIKIKLKDKG